MDALFEKLLRCHLDSQVNLENEDMRNAVVIQNLYHYNRQSLWDILRNTPPKFNSSPLKNDGWKTSFLLGFGDFQGRTVKLPGGELHFLLLPVEDRKNGYIQFFNATSNIKDQA